LVFCRTYAAEKFIFGYFVAFRILTVPFDTITETFAEDLLNRFCTNKRVLSKQVEFFTCDGKPFWSVFLEYESLDGSESKTSRDLDQQQNLLLKRLREWRKQCAEDQGVPGFIVATNRELEELVRLRPKTIEAVKSINGIGKKKIERYGKAILQIVSDFYANDKK
jgi:superfamily II DNA helicase RecQ